ncbi:hypothetical protein [Hydrogenophaga sp. T2]|uniref:hypothetical protein n=1 Tax=Hydrogenophaga sp. T2 TaxID=3132823 RepID=UPI003CF498B1
MKASRQRLALAAAAAAVFGTSIAHAESTYGYNTTGAAVSATARVAVNVTVPKVIMLRVGSDNTAVDTVAITLTPNGVGTEGNALPFSWDGSAPTFMASTAPGLAAYAWTNVTGATLNGAVTTPDAGTTGLTASAIDVTASTTGTNPLPHPGTNTGTFTPVALAPNVAYSGTWTFGLNPTAAAAAAAGTFSQTVTYTASAL